MDVKYTFRDIVVYLLTGFISVTILLFTFPSFFYDLLLFFHPNDGHCIYAICDYLQSHETIAVIICIPFLYVVGHFIQVLDLMFSFYIARFFKKFRVTQIIYKIAGSTTVEYQRNIQGLNEPQFIAKEYTVRIMDRYKTVEYYYLLKELFNGLRTFLIILFLVDGGLLILGKLPLSLFLFNSILLILCWIKAWNSASNYVWGLRNTHDALKRNGIIGKR